MDVEGARKLPSTLQRHSKQLGELRMGLLGGCAAPNTLSPTEMATQWMMA